jgi:hypothetical protein
MSRHPAISEGQNVRWPTEMGFFRRAATPAEIEQVRSELASLRETIERHGSTTVELEGRLRALDSRVTGVSTELANQLTELGHDIDALDGHDHGNGVDPAVLDEIRDGQVRLANEQARYQMAFREDLARLATELTRAR